jgi:uncharacterized protein YbjT (DUF2867 family)
MKIVVIGGSGLIGSQLVGMLRERGHDVVAASPSSGVNAVTGEGLAGALEGSQVVVDVSNSPSFEDKAALEFFERSSGHLRAAEIAAGVKHHVALSVVGTQRMPDSGYMRAKARQEVLIRGSEVAFTIVHATQFFEFLATIAGAYGQGDTIRLPAGNLQPIAARDVAAALADYALGAPVNDVVEIAGPEKAPLHELVARYLAAIGDKRKVVRDDTAQAARLGATDLDSWIAQARKR